jgi:uncharacterized membrane protein
MTRPVKTMRRQRGSIHYPERHEAAAWAITVLGLGLRLYRIGYHSLWFDEIIEYQRATTSWPVLLHGRAMDLDPPIYTVLLRGWLQLCQAEWFLRTLSALAGALAIYVLYRWARHIVGPTTALLAAWLLCIAPAAVHHSQEVNQYGLVLLLSALLLLSVERVIANGSPAAWSGLALVTAVSLGSHYSLAWLVSAAGGYLFLFFSRGRNRAQLWSWLAYAGAAAGISAVVFLSSHTASKIADAQAGWRRLVQPATPAGSVASAYAHRLWRDVIAFLTAPALNDGLPLALAGLLGLTLIGAVRLARQDTAGRRVLLIMLTALAAIIVAAGFGLYPLKGRHILFLAPLAYLTLAAGLAVFESRRLVLFSAAAGVTVLFVVSIPSMPFAVRDWTPREDIDPVLRYVDAHRQPGEPIYVYYGAGPAFDHYYDGPQDTVTRPGWLRGESIEVQVNDFLAAAEGQPTIWYVYTHVNPDHYAVLDRLREDYDFQITATYQAPGAGTYRLQRADRQAAHDNSAPQ